MVNWSGRSLTPKRQKNRTELNFKPLPTLCVAHALCRLRCMLYLVSLTPCVAHAVCCPPMPCVACTVCHPPALCVVHPCCVSPTPYVTHAVSPMLCVACTVCRPPAPCVVPCCHVKVQGRVGMGDVGMCTGIQEGVGRWGLCTKPDERKPKTSNCDLPRCLCWHVTSHPHNMEGVHMWDLYTKYNK